LHAVCGFGTWATKMMGFADWLKVVSWVVVSVRPVAFCRGWGTRKNHTDCAVAFVKSTSHKLHKKFMVCVACRNWLVD
jgi:hypothetical protein